MNLFEEIQEEKLFRKRFLANHAQGDSFAFGFDMQTSLPVALAITSPFIGVPVRLAYSEFYSYQSMSKCQIFYEYLEQHKTATQAPEHIYKSPIKFEFKKHKEAIFEIIRSSEIYETISKHDEDGAVSLEKYLGFNSVRRNIFNRALDGSLKPQASQEFLILQKFLSSYDLTLQRVNEKYEEIYGHCKKDAANTELGFIGVSSGVFGRVPALHLIDCDIIAFGQPLLYIANQCYGLLLKHVNDNKLDFTENLFVCDVLYSIMTLVDSTLPLHYFLTSTKDKNKRQKLGNIMDAYFLSMSAKKEFGEDLGESVGYLIGLGKDEQNSEEKRRTQKSLDSIIKAKNRETAFSQKDSIDEFIQHYREKSSSNRELNDSTLTDLPAFSYCNTAHYFYESNKIVQIFSLFNIGEALKGHSDLYFKTDNVISDYRNFQFVLDVANHEYEELKVQCENFVIKYDLVQELMRLAVMCKKLEGKHLVDSFKNFVCDDFREGELFKILENLYAKFPNLFDFSKPIGTDATGSLAVEMIKAFKEIESGSNLEEVTQELFEKMTQLSQSKDFDPDEFTNLSLEYADSKKKQLDSVNNSEQIYNKFLDDSKEYLKDLDRANIEEVKISQKDAQEQDAVLEEALDLAESLEEALKVATGKADALEQQLEAINTKSEQVEPRINDDVTKLLINCIRKGEISTVVDALKIAEVMSEGKLIILPSAYESAADSAFNQCRRVLDTLLILPESYIDAIKEGGTEVARSLFPTRVYRRGESDTVMQNPRLREMRMWTYEGEKRLFTSHLALGAAASPNKHLRIYFDYDIEKDVIIIAYCGRHLESAADL